ncbi:MAG: trigger factor [Eubacterium sp.]|nr:trigger factor [Eubacterium sp.]
MNYTTETIDGNKAKFTITVESEAFNAARDKAFKKNQKKISIPGFRKGKVPRKMIEKMYGKEIFDEDAINSAAPEAYEEVRKDSDLTILSYPSYDMVDVTDDDTFIFTATVAIAPEVKLGEYKGLEVSKTEVNVTDEDVDNEIERVRQQNGRMIEVSDRAVKDDDIVKIDFEGFIDGEPFDGGKGEDYDLVIGSHSFIDNFEEQLIGKNIGDDVDVNVTFPEEYHEESLKGKPALFKVKIKKITEKELPDVDDEFAEEVSEFDTLKEYKDDIRKSLTERREKNALNAKEEEAVSMLVENCEIDLAEEAIDFQVEQMVQEFGYRLQMQGMDPSQYLQMTGMTPQMMMSQMRPEAERRIKTRLALEAVVKAENIEADEDAINEEIKEMATAYGQTEEEYRENITDKDMETRRMDAAVKKAAEFVRDQAKEVEKKETKDKEEAKD